jgi:hypothetical protein
MEVDLKAESSQALKIARKVPKCQDSRSWRKLTLYTFQRTGSHSSRSQMHCIGGDRG